MVTIQSLQQDLVALRVQAEELLFYLVCENGDYISLENDESTHNITHIHINDDGVLELYNGNNIVSVKDLSIEEYIALVSAVEQQYLKDIEEWIG